MYRRRQTFFIGLFIGSFITAAACSAQAQPDANDLNAELQKLKAEFEEMKTSYEARIRALEQKIAEQEFLKKTLEHKQKEIQALNEKVARLERSPAFGGEAPAGTTERPETVEAPRHRAAPVGAYGGLMNPDVSVVLDVQGLVTDEEANPADEKIMVKHAELALQGYLYPGVRGDFIGAIGQHPEESGHIHTHVEVEEAFVSFLDLPADFQLQLGRKLLDFGRLNPLHPHHWAVADTPLALRRLFGDHPWYDDGLQVSTLIPNPWDVYVKAAAGIWNGRQLGEDEHEDADEAHQAIGFKGPVSWAGRVYTGRASLDLPLSSDTNIMAGYSFARDEGGETSLHGADLTFIHRWPMTFRKLRWQNEFFFGNFELAEHAHDDGFPQPSDLRGADTDAWGLYSLLQLTLNKYWETGLRCDLWDPDYRDREWSAAAFLSYYFTHSMYLRPEYRYSELGDGETENAFLLQFVWGLGPHAHRLED